MHTIQDDVVAVGGKDHDLNVWDINSGKQIWKAKNVFNLKTYLFFYQNHLFVFVAQLPLDHYRDQVPIWITDMSFLPTDPKVMIVSTNFGEVLNCFSTLQLIVMM